MYFVLLKFQKMEHLSEDYWTNRYVEEKTGWDIGQASTPLVAYIDQMKDKNAPILIPGAGNAYEAVYLYESGFTDITICDLSLEPLKKFHGHAVIKCIHGDFFELEESNKFATIFEQTFFCAIHPALRMQYLEKMTRLLSPKGKLVGLLFASDFEKEGPPFGGDINEYKILFGKSMKILVMDFAYNSILPRKDNEIFIILEKNE
jgi:methyl halide transferase